MAKDKEIIIGGEDDAADEEVIESGENSNYPGIEGQPVT